MKIEIFKSEYGLKVIHHKTQKYKTITINLLLLDDLNYKTNSQLSLLKEIMVKATKNYPSKKEFSSYLEENYDIKLTSTATSFAETSIVGFSLTGINSKFIDFANINEKLFYLLDEIIFNPLILEGKFKEPFFNNQLRLFLEDIKSSEEIKEKMASLKVQEILGKNTPFGVLNEGELSQAKKIKNELIVEEYYKLLKRDAYLLIVGDIEKEEINTYLSKYLKLKTKNIKRLSAYKKEIPDKKERSLASNFSQSSVILIYDLSVYVDEPLSPAATLFNSILNYYLFKKVREENNLCYTISSFYNSTLGMLKIITNIKSVDYKATKDLIDKIIIELKTKIDLSIFNNLKNKFINKLERDFDTQGSEIVFGFNKLVFGIDSTIKKNIEKIKNVKPEEIKEVATLVKRKLSFILKEKE